MCLFNESIESGSSGWAYCSLIMSNQNTWLAPSPEALRVKTGNAAQWLQQYARVAEGQRRLQARIMDRNQGTGATRNMYFNVEHFP
jgi:hypothetical protein